MQRWTVPKRNRWRRNLTLEDTPQVSLIIFRFHVLLSLATFSSLGGNRLFSHPLDLRLQISLFRRGEEIGLLLYHYTCVISWTFLSLVFPKDFNLTGRFLVIFFLCLIILFFICMWLEKPNKQLNISGKAIFLFNTRATPMMIPV